MSPRRAAAGAEELVTAAGELIARHGAGDVHLRDLAAATGVSLGTVYNRFPSKDHLLAAVREQVEQRFVDAMTRAAPHDRPLRESVPQLVTALLETAAASPLTRVLLDLAHTPLVADPDEDVAQGRSIRQWIAARVTHAQDRGELAPDDPDLVADLGFALVAAGLHHLDPVSGHRTVHALLVEGLSALLTPAGPPTRH